MKKERKKEKYNIEKLSSIFCRTNFKTLGIPLLRKCFELARLKFMTSHLKFPPLDIINNMVRADIC